MEKTFKDVSWSDNMKRAYRMACHDRARKRQDRLFEFYAMLRQKIIGCLIAVISMALWIALTLYDTVQIWWGVELVPLMVIGFYVMLTNKELHMETK